VKKQISFRRFLSLNQGLELKTPATDIDDRIARFTQETENHFERVQGLLKEALKDKAFRMFVYERFDKTQKYPLAENVRDALLGTESVLILQHFCYGNKGHEPNLGLTNNLTLVLTRNEYSHDARIHYQRKISGFRFTDSFALHEYLRVIETREDLMTVIYYELTRKR